MASSFCKPTKAWEKSQLLQLIKNHGQITRSQIVALSGYSNGNISTFIRTLMEDGYIIEDECGASTGGRKAGIIRLNGNYGAFLGCELGGYELKASLCDFSGKVLHSDKMLENNLFQEPESAIGMIVEFVNAFLDSCQVDRSKMISMGMGVSGIIDHDTGRCLYYKNQSAWKGIPLKKRLEDALGFPCDLEDSSRAMAVSEKVYGSCRDVEDFIVFSVGVGLGVGIYSQNTLFRGRHGHAGEIGHMVIKENGPRCVCGNYGCLESLASGQAIEYQAHRAIQNRVHTSLSELPEIKAKDVIMEAHKGDKLSYSIISDCAKHLGIGIANAINIFNPQKIVITGGISNAGKLLMNPILNEIRSSALETHLRDCEIVLSELNEYSATYGMADMCLTRFCEAIGE